MRENVGMDLGDTGDTDMSDFADGKLFNMPSFLGFGYDDWLYNQKKQREIYQNEYNAINNLKIGYEKHLSKQGLKMNPNRAWLAYDNQLNQLQNNIRNSQFATDNSLLQSFGLTNGYGVFRVPRGTYRWL